ncbi:MAG TPA: hypothetical protein DDY98_02320, partial [Ruminococcaceae bacterium]|nr:hypothetical protein [Oscillospiraceae bacterium]
ACLLACLPEIIADAVIFVKPFHKVIYSYYIIINKKCKQKSAFSLFCVGTAFVYFAIFSNSEIKRTGMIIISKRTVDIFIFSFRIIMVLLRQELY